LHGKIKCINFDEKIGSANVLGDFFTITSGHTQGCQIFFLDQNGGKYTKLPLNYQMAINFTKQP
jgi:hypothetical protein